MGQDMQGDPLGHLRSPHRFFHALGPMRKDRREQLRKLVPNLPDTIRYSETFNVPLAELTRAVKKHQLEGIVAKRSGSPYRSGERSADWLKWRANRGQEFVIDGYIPNGDVLDSLLVGYYERHKLMYAASVRAGIPAQYRRVLLAHFDALRIQRCPFANLPDRGEGRWGEGLSAGENDIVPLAKTIHRRENRVPGTDTRQSIVAPAVRWHSER